MRTVRLLPPGHRLGWTPYAWLLYLVTFFIEPVIRTAHGRAGTLYWAATLLGTVIFLWAYFAAHWQRGIRILPYAGMILLLGLLFTPFNTGAPVFFVYAAAAAANVDRTRLGFALVGGAAALGTAAVLLAGGPSYGVILASLVTLLVGSVNVHFAAEGRAQSRLRLAQEQVEHLAAVAERERIARDLHDVLGHTLSLIVLKSELAHRLAERDPARAAAEMKDVEGVARRTLQEVRETIRGYHPTLADERGRAEAMLRAAGIRAELVLDELPLPQVVEETLALALREAVTNVARHSGASWCSATLQRHPASTTLRVQDDGRGMKAREGHGLRGMRERVEAFGGTVEASSGESRFRTGLQLRVTMPVATRHEDGHGDVVATITRRPPGDTVSAADA